MLIELFLVFFQIGLFSFGGGYAAMPLIQSLVVEQHGWLTIQEYADLTTIAEMTPGPIMVNAATFTGQKMAGFLGSVVCTLGCVLPSFLIVLLLAYFYTKYRNLKSVKQVMGTLRPAVVSLIAKAGITILLLCLFETTSFQNVALSNFHPLEFAVFVICFIWLRKFHGDPIHVIFGSAIIGLALTYLL